MEQHLGRKLLPNETIDHQNRNKTDDRIENLLVRDRAEHTSLDNRRVFPIEIVCVWCGTKATKQASNLRGNSKQGKAGPFCGKSCAGKYGAAVQNGLDKMQVQDSPISKYFYLDKSR